MGAIVALGIIFGDIGTSPLYVFRAILASIGDVTADTIIGALSCIVWTLTLQTTVKYVFITLKADNRGEGGIFSLVKVKLYTGRTHQIRVQFASRKHPLAGDGKYGSRYKGYIRLFCKSIDVAVPGQKEKRHFEVPLPEDFLLLD